MLAGEFVVKHGEVVDFPVNLEHRSEIFFRPHARDLPDEELARLGFSHACVAAIRTHLYSFVQGKIFG